MFSALNSSNCCSILGSFPATTLHNSKAPVLDPGVSAIAAVRGVVGNVVAPTSLGESPLTFLVATLGAPLTVPIATFIFLFAAIGSSPQDSLTDPPSCELSGVLYPSERGGATKAVCGGKGSGGGVWPLEAGPGGPPGFHRGEPSVDP